MIELDEKRIQEITDYMFLPDNPIKADATIVLGQTLWQRPFQKGVALYRAGLSGKLVFTGGYNPKLDAREADEMFKAWMEMSYGLEHVLIDDRARNTMENMLNAKRLLEEAGIHKSGIKINLISINYHVRRAVETFKFIFKDDDFELGVVNYPSKYCAIDAWANSENGRKLVINELHKILEYLKTEPR